MQRCVPLLRGRVYLCPSGQKLLHDFDVTLLGGQVEGVEAVGVASVDVGVGLEVLEDLLKVAASGRTEEAGVVVRLENREMHKVRIVESSIFLKLW